MDLERRIACASIHVILDQLPLRCIGGVVYERTVNGQCAAQVHARLFFSVLYACTEPRGMCQPDGMDHCRWPKIDA